MKIMSAKMQELKKPTARRLRIITAFMIPIFILCADCKKTKEEKRISTSGVVHQSHTVRCKGYKGEVTVKTDLDQMFAYAKNPDNVSFLGGKIFRQVSEGPPDITAVGKPIVLEANILGNRFNITVLPARLVNEPDRKEIWMVVFGRIKGVAKIKMTPDENHTRLIQDIYIELPDKAIVDMAERLGVDEQLCKGFDKGLARVQADFDPNLDQDELTSHGLRGELYETLWQKYETSVWINASPENVIREGIYPDNIRGILATAHVEGLSECLNEPENRCRWEKGSGEPVYCPVKLNIAGFKWRADVFDIINPDDAENFCIMYGVIKNILFQLRLVGQPEKGGTRVSMSVAIEPPGSANPDLMDLILTISGLPGWMEKMLLEVKSRVEGLA
jgi:hypothetical protein